MTAFFIYPLIAAALYYLGSRAAITAPLWSRYPKAIASFMDCAACAGTWYGFGITVTGGTIYNLDFAGLDGADPVTWIVGGLCATITTPLVAALHLKALEFLGSAVSDDEPTESGHGA
jgi:hypothetical protein